MFLLILPPGRSDYKGMRGDKRRSRNEAKLIAQFLHLAPALIQGRNFRKTRRGYPRLGS